MRIAFGSSLADTTTIGTAENFQRNSFSESRPAWPGRPRSSSASSGGLKCAMRWNAASRFSTAATLASAKAFRTTAERISRSSGSSSTIRTSMVSRAPPHRLEQAYAGRDRHVEALHFAAHRDLHQQVAGLARQAAHALALGAEHPRDRVGQVGLVQRALGALVGADDPDVA